MDEEPETDAPAPAPKDETPWLRAAVKLEEMAEAAHAEAHRIESAQRALIAAGYRVEFHPGQMRLAHVFWKLGDFLQTLREVEHEMVPILRRHHERKKR